jgi:hypothetical protein
MIRLVRRGRRERSDAVIKQVFLSEKVGGGGENNGGKTKYSEKGVRTGHWERSRLMSESTQAESGMEAGRALDRSNGDSGLWRFCRG